MAKLLIKSLCKAKGIPMKVMAEKMGMDASTFSQFVSSPNPSIPTLERIAGVLNVNIGDLFERKYELVSGFLATSKESFIVKSKEDWAVATQKIDGYVKAPYYANVEDLRKDVQHFVVETENKKTDAVFMAQLGADVIVTLIAYPTVEIDENESVSYEEYRLVTCDGNSNTKGFFFSTLEFQGDLNGLVQEIWNDVEAVYEDTEFGEELK